MLDGNRACRGRIALGGGNGSRDGVDRWLRTGVAARSGTVLGAVFDRSGESARGGLRGRRAREAERGIGEEEVDMPLVRPVLPFA